MANRIVLENARTDGVADRSYWDVDHTKAIEGFATDMSRNAGQTVDFKINVNNGGGTDYKVEIFRLGYYDGHGAREVAEWTNTNAVDQAVPLYDESRGLVDAGNWLVTDSWQIPADAVSGVYLARIQRLDANGNPIAGEANQIPFIVRNDGEPADIVLQTSDTTWHAYNGWAGELGNADQAGPNFYGDAAGIVDHPDLPNSGGFAQDRAYAVSYNRPFITRDGTSPASGAQDYLFGADYAAIHWLEQNGYDVTYISGVDTDRMGTDWYKDESGTVIRKSFISVGHDEYWSGDQRINVENARDDGVHLMFWAGNEVYWKTRWDVSISADGTEHRTLVCYKETWANGDSNAAPGDYNNIDPTDIWTGTWRDTRFWESTDAEGNLIAGGKYYVEGGGAAAHVDTLSGLRSTCNCAENSLTGTLFGPDGNGQRGSIDVPTEYGNLRVWRNTTIAAVGDDLNMADGIIGYEWNTVPEDELRPAGLIRLSSTTLAWNNIVVDEGNSAPAGVATHSLSLYRAESGALVFGAGTVFWSWGLSDEHDASPYGGDIESAAFKQFTVNMFADMGIQPGVADAILTAQGLIRAAASTDVTPATVTIDAPSGEVHALQNITLSGTATDDDGNALTDDGTVALVEISFDGGQTWRSTTGTANWSYNWRPTSEGAVTIQVRAVDDSLNVWNATPTATTLAVQAPVMPDTFGLFEGMTPAGYTLYNDGQSTELGMKFSVSLGGAITELKYYRDAADAGDTDVRTGHLWRVSDGALLATVTFNSGVGQSGWQVAALSAPVGLQAGVDYLVSYRTEDNYVSTNGFFSPSLEVAFDGVDDDAFSDYFGVIRAPQNSVVGDAGTGGNGIYRYGAGGVMPNQTYQSSNYWVDVTFDDAAGPNTPPVITSGASFLAAENQLVAGTITASDAENAVTFAIAGGVDAAKFTINGTTGALRFVTAPDFEVPGDTGGNNVYDLIVSASDGVADPVTQEITVTVTDALDLPLTGSSIFEGETPTNAVSNDNSDYELGTKFVANQSGYVTQLRYYRMALDSGDAETRVLNLWDATTGANLGSVSVESLVGATGWQSGVLAAPVQVTAGTTYIVSYGYDQDQSNDAYAATGGFFASASNDSPDGALTALISGAPTGAGSGGIGNGLYSTTPGTLPQQSFNSSNYWVDVVFTTGEGGENTPPVITSPAGFSVGENQTAVGSITATDAENAVTYAIAGGVDAGLFTINASTGALSFLAAPDYEAPGDAGADNTYDLVVSASDGVAPAVTQAITVTVTDAAEPAGSTLYGAGDAPAAAGTDATDYELGTRFQSSVGGTIAALQYYRVAGDAGDIETRTLNLWTAGGVNLGSAQVTSGVGVTGWQVATLLTPIAISAGTTYIVSYGYDQDGVNDAYGYTAGYFTVAHTGPDGVLTGLAGGNGVFNDGTAGAFPNTASGSNANYWTDVVFAADTGENTAPVFVSPSLFGAAENQVLVGTIAATDANGDLLSFGIAAGDDGALFTIDSQTGALRFKTPQDFESDASYQLTITVSDGAETTSQLFTVNLTDVDETVDGAAAMTGATLTANYVFGQNIGELYSPGTGVSQTAVVGAGVEFLTLPDAGPDVGNGPYGLASVDVGAQGIRIEFPLDAGFGAYLPFATIANKPYNGVHLLDTTNGMATILSARIIGQEGFTDQSGALVNLTAADLTVTADGIFLNVAGKGRTTDVDPDAAGLQHSYVTLLVDLNDAPEISANGGAAAVSLEVAENTTLVSTLAATDADGHAVSFALSGEDAGLFQIVGNTLHFIAAPDAEALPAFGATPGYQVTVTASDGFGGSDSQDVSVAVGDVNEFAVSLPVDTDAADNSIAETAAAGTAVGITASATDGDATTNAVTYSLVDDADGRFVIDAGTGVVTVANGAVFDIGSDGPVLGIIVRATSQDGSHADTQAAIALTGGGGVPVTAPVDTDGAVDFVNENAAIGTAVGLTAHAVDADASNNQVTYSLTDNAGGRFAIDATTGVVTVAGAINRELTGPSLGITVLATSQDGSTASANFAIAIGDVNEFAVSSVSDMDPAPNVVAENSAAGTVVGYTARATDADATANGVTYSLVKSGSGRFVVDATTGVITVAAGAVLDYETQSSYSIKVKATSADGSASSRTFTLALSDVAEDPDAGQLLTGTSSANALTGAAGNDTIDGLGGNDTLTGNDGADLASGGTGNDLLYGGLGDDTLTGGVGTDTVYGGDGDDLILISGADDAADLMFGGAGTDTIRVVAAGGTVTLAALTVADVEIFDGSGQVVSGNGSANILDFSTFASVINVAAILGGAKNDLILGSGQADVIDGGSGTDTIHGGDGDDIVIVRSDEAKTDLMTGDGGSDTLRFAADSGVVTLTGLPAGFEVLEGNGKVLQGTSAAEVFDLSGFASVSGLAAVLGQSGNDQITGTGGADSLDGGAGNDTLAGGDGADTLLGGSGKDALTGGLGADDFVFNTKPSGSTNVDTIADFTVGEDRLVFDHAIFTGLAAGALPEDQFIASAYPADIGDRLMYEAATGKLYYDVDGLGGAGRAQIALLSGAPALTAADIFVI